MKIERGILLIIACVIFSSHPIFARPTYTGYSSAPGCRGTCANTCHGGSGGTIQVSGFPSEYNPGETYTITVSHNGGSSIKQFNGSCRIGNGSSNAGLITAGTNTATYNLSMETNGVHLSTTDRDNCTFFWTAPVSGTGEVRLYIAGHQGNYSGQNTRIVLASNEQMTDIDDDNSNMPSRYALLGNYPNPFNGSTVIRYVLPVSSNVKIEVFDILGSFVETLSDENQPAGYHQVIWSARNLPSGAYFYRIQAGDFVDSREMLFLK